MSDPVSERDRRSRSGDKVRRFSGEKRKNSRSRLFLGDEGIDEGLEYDIRHPNKALRRRALIGAVGVATM
jgi:hypothetical protein